MPKHILIADDDRALVRLLAVRCRSLGLKVEEAGDGFLAATNIFMRGEHGHPPDLIILDIEMPGEDGLSICEELLLDDLTANVPVIVLTGRSDRATLARCAELGVHYVRKTGDVWLQLEPLICNLLEFEVEYSREGSTAVPKGELRDELPGAPKVLCVDDDHLFTKVLEIRLNAQGVKVVRAFNGREGFWQALTERPQVILTDYAMPNGRGSFLLRRLKSHPLTSNIPVIVITGRDILASPSGKPGSTLKRRLEKMGAAQVLSKPLEYDHLMHELSRFIRIDDVVSSEPVLVHEFVESV